MPRMIRLTPTTYGTGDLHVDADRIDMLYADDDASGDARTRVCIQGKLDAWPVTETPERLNTRRPLLSKMVNDQGPPLGTVNLNVVEGLNVFG